MSILKKKQVLNDLSFHFRKVEKEINTKESRG